jgi:ferredoxin
MTKPPQELDIRHLTGMEPWINFDTGIDEEERVMAMKINEECIACGACIPECPTESISEGDGVLYVIDQATCVECEGHYDSPKCVSVCPVECIVKAG